MSNKDENHNYSDYDFGEIIGNDKDDNLTPGGVNRNLEK